MAAVLEPTDRSTRDSAHGPRIKLPPSLFRPTARAAFAGTGLISLVAVSAMLRLEGSRTLLWMDEGISVGIASHRLGDIPQVLRVDGSPPLYFLVLKGWMKLVGSSEADVHALSTLFAVATVPVAYWAGRSLFDRRTGWICSGLAATNPYLTFYSHEARMYTMAALLGLVTVATFLHAFAFGRRRYLPAFVLSLVLSLYTHNWSLFLVIGLVAATVLCVATAADRGRQLRDALMAFGAVGLLYAPWLPTLLYQQQHTSAPWLGARSPPEAIRDLIGVLGDERIVVALLLTAGIALGSVLLRPKHGGWPPVAALVLVVAVTPLASWMSSLLQPSWAARYFGTFLLPLLLLAALGLSRDRGRGLLAFGLILLLWTTPLARIRGLHRPPPADEKSNVQLVASELRHLMRPGDLVVSPQVEQVPLLHYYFPPGLEYATPEGAVSDPQVVDWRDAVSRLSRSTVATGLQPLVNQLAPSGRVFLICPHFVPIGSDEYAPRRQAASTQPETGPGARTEQLLPPIATAGRDSTEAWGPLVVQHCRASLRSLADDPRMRLVAGPTPPIGTPARGASVFAVTYEKVST
ncbi:MAG: glycosyltransferase family 39 protein [Actinomycetota bacterium]|nr:glycosyltransferase family 39 protein [Actinomycetota bacterium]